jgi:pimeloyl-ACP methyl ester carboxylesterase
MSATVGSVGSTGRFVDLPRRGRTFVREHPGPEGAPTVVLLHGWATTAALNWAPSFGPLSEHFRVIALDHRGHGRGLRAATPFRLADCADDVAALLATLDIPQCIAVGYSMGGPIAQLMARDHPDVVSGIVLCATSTNWRDVRQQILWNSLALLRFWLGLAPDTIWRRALRLGGFPDSPVTTWTTSELTRGSASDLAEAGHELSRFDSRKWIGDLTVPAAVIVTLRDQGVPPGHQRDLAERLQAPVFEIDGDHGAAISKARQFNPLLLEALDTVDAAAAGTQVAA